jgi:multisubunit Na+/H+ antiporter MnhE subunit
MKVIKKIYLVIFFLAYYLFKVVQANIYIAYDILTPKNFATPEFIWIPIKVKSDIGILLLSNLITMTPGTLTVELTNDKKKILVHSLYNTMDGKVISDINQIQSKIIKLTT